MSAIARNLDEGTFSPSTDKYKEKLLDPRWKARREQILKRDGYRCVNCGDTIELEVHHRKYFYILGAGCYQNPWDYPDHLLITLCRTCHNSGHSQYVVPVTFINDKPKNL